MPKKKTKKKAVSRKKAPAPKKAAAKKIVKKTLKKKKVATKKVAKKAPAKKKAPKKKTAQKAVTQKTSPKNKPVRKGAKKVASKTKTVKRDRTSSEEASPARSTTSAKKPGPRFPIVGKKNYFQDLQQSSSIKKRKLSKSFLNKQQGKLVELRDHIVAQMQGVAQDSLRSKSDAAGSAFGMHQADAGSDAYEKDFALSLLSQEQDALYEVDQALKRIDQGTYGVCEMSGEQIPKNRLEAIPYARFTAICQDKMEKEMKNRGRWESAPQFMKSSDNFFEESESSDDDSRPNNKD